MEEGLQAMPEEALSVLVVCLSVLSHGHLLLFSLVLWQEEDILVKTMFSYAETQ